MTTDQEAIRHLIERWHRLTAAGDVDGILGLMTDDVVFLTAGQPPVRGRDAFGKGLRSLLAEHRVDSSAEVQEMAVDGDLAYCWTALVVRIAPRAGGAGEERRGSTLSIFRRVDGRWALARDANLLPPRA
jgi:uncharacterized protein (TIGR02246 family)